MTSLIVTTALLPFASASLTETTFGFEHQHLTTTHEDRLQEVVDRKTEWAEMISHHAHEVVEFLEEMSKHGYEHPKYVL